MKKEELTEKEKRMLEEADREILGCSWEEYQKMNRRNILIAIGCMFIFIIFLILTTFVF